MFLYNRKMQRIRIPHSQYQFIVQNTPNMPKYFRNKKHMFGEMLENLKRKSYWQKTTVCFISSYMFFPIIHVSFIYLPLCIGIHIDEHLHEHLLRTPFASTPGEHPLRTTSCRGTTEFAPAGRHVS